MNCMFYEDTVLFFQPISFRYFQFFAQFYLLLQKRLFPNDNSNWLGNYIYIVMAVDEFSKGMAADDSARTSVIYFLQRSPLALRQDNVV